LAPLRIIPAVRTRVSRLEQKPRKSGVQIAETVSDYAFCLRE
jgi:hypothetical protein